MRNENIAYDATEVGYPVVEPGTNVGVRSIVCNPAANETVHDRDVSHRVAEKNPVAVRRWFRGKNGKAIQIKRHIATKNGHAMAGGDGDVRGEVIGAGLNDRG